MLAHSVNQLVKAYARAFGQQAQALVL